jgi:iron complex outermembrane recepter protein
MIISSAAQAAFLGGTACIVIASTAVAQTTAPAAAETLSEVVVTADKRQEAASTVPVSVDVVSSAFLTNISADQLSDYVGYLPNVFLLGDGAPGYARIYIRGITTVGGGSSVGVYVDDAPFGSSTSFAQGANLQPDLDPSSLQQIEVLKGPQGALYGAGSEGGLIKYVTREPNTRTASFGFTQEGSTMDHGDGGYALRAHGNLPLIEDALAVEANVYYRRDPGFIDNLATGKTDDNDDIARGAYVSVLAVPTENLKIRLSALVQSLDAFGLDSIPVGAGIEQTGGVLGPPVFGRYTTYLRDSQGSFTQDRLYTASVSYQLPWGSLASTTSYSRVDNHTGYGDSGYDNASYGINPADTVQNSDQSGTNKVSEELRLTSLDESSLQWLLGGFFTHENSFNIEPTLAHLDGAPDNTAAPAGNLYTEYLGTKYSELSAFGNATHTLWRQLYLTLGGRYSEYFQDYVQTQAGELGNPDDPGVAAISGDAKTRDGAFTYLTTLSWRFLDQGSVYFRAASGYRVGGPAPLPPGIALPPGFDGKFGSENLYDYEVGLKRAFFEGRLALQADTFYIDYRNIQGNKPVLGGLYVVRGNPGDAQSHGVEIALQGRPVQGLTVDGAFGYADATLTQDAPNFGALKGDDLTNSPHFTASLNVGYEHPLGGDLFGMVGGGVRYVSSSYGDFSSAPDATYFPAQTILDLHAGVRVGHFTATLFVKNATNTYEYENNTGVSPNGPPYVSVTPPRTIGIRLSEDF